MLQKSGVHQRVDSVVLGVEDDFRGKVLIEYLKSRCDSVQTWWGLDARKNPELVIDYAYPAREELLYSRRLLAGELACSIGHYQIIQSFRDKPVDWLMICEDNLSIQNLDLAIKFLNETRIEKPSLINFGLTKYNLSFPSLSSKFLKRNFTIPTSTKCYAINSGAIFNILLGYDKWKVDGYQADFPPFYFDYLKFYFSEDIELKSDGSHIIESRNHSRDLRSVTGRTFKQPLRIFKMLFLRRKHISFKSYIALKLGRFVAERSIF